MLFGFLHTVTKRGHLSPSEEFSQMSHWANFPVKKTLNVYYNIFFSEPDHQFMVNDQFSSKLYRVKIQTGKYISIISSTGFKPEDLMSWCVAHLSLTIWFSCAGMPMGGHKKSGITFCGKPVCVCVGDVQCSKGAMTEAQNGFLSFGKRLASLS